MLIVTPIRGILRFYEYGWILKTYFIESFIIIIQDIAAYNSWFGGVEISLATSSGVLRVIDPFMLTLHIEHLRLIVHVKI